MGSSKGSVNHPVARSSMCDKFLRQMGRLDGEIKKRIHTAMLYLLESRNPRKCGWFKGREYVPGHDAQKSVNAYEISELYRLVYAVHGDTVMFLRVGDHKAAYGRDRRCAGRRTGAPHHSARRSARRCRLSRAGPANRRVGLRHQHRKQEAAARLRSKHAGRRQCRLPPIAATHERGLAQLRHGRRGAVSGIRVLLAARP